MLQSVGVIAATPSPTAPKPNTLAIFAFSNWAIEATQQEQNCCGWQLGASLLG
jgi:hypothetical protein